MLAGTVEGMKPAEVAFPERSLCPLGAPLGVLSQKVHFNKKKSIQLKTLNGLSLLSNHSASQSSDIASIQIEVRLIAEHEITT